MSRTRKKDKKAEVIKALNDKRWEYRTVVGISKQVHITADEVAKIIESSAAVRKSVAKTAKGASLYTLKSRKSAVGDYVAAFRKLSKDKYEAYEDDDS